MPRLSARPRALALLPLPVCLLTLLAGASPVAARADATASVFHDFAGTGSQAGTGVDLAGGVTIGPDGLFYGVATLSGYDSERDSYGNGVLYSLDANGNETVLHSFDSSGNHFALPETAVTFDGGTVYGTTDDPAAVFKFDPASGYAEVQTISTPNPAQLQQGGLTVGKDGRLYGVAQYGGGSGYGVIFSLSADGSDERTEYTFDGDHLPVAELTPAPGSGNAFYGTTEGAYNPNNNTVSNDGTVFEFTPGASPNSGTVKILHAFGDGSVANDGRVALEVLAANGRLQLDSSGDLFGITILGGAYDEGTIFELAPNGAETILHSFGSIANDGYSPRGGLTLASDGYYYGTTPKGGANGGGAVYRIKPNGSGYGIVYNGGSPSNDDSLYYFDSKLAQDSNGYLYGTGLILTDDYYGTSDDIVFRLDAGLPSPVKLSKLTVSLSSVVGGRQNATGTITLNKVAPSGGAVVVLTSTNTNAATVPTSITIPAGSTTATFTITTKAVDSSAVLGIDGTYNNSSAGTRLTVTPPTPALSSVSLSPATTVGGSGATTANRVYLSSNATADTTVTITSSNPSVAKITTTPVTIKTGSSSHVFAIQTSAVNTNQTVTITATANGMTQSATLTVTPGTPPLQSVNLSPTSTVGGSGATTANRVYLTGNATEDTTVTITSSNTNIATISTTPVTIKAGSSSHVFTIQTGAVKASTSVTITATANGVSKSSTLTVTP